MNEKRKDYLSWDEYFMGIALLSAQRSKDPNSQVGCCFVDENNRILSVGYNGFPNNISDDEFPWARIGKPLDTKYLYVCHSELNAILNTNNDLKNSILYVTMFPCNECTKAIIQKGIKKIIYLIDKYPDSDSVIASKKMLDAVGITYEQYKENKNKIILNL